MKRLKKNGGIKEDETLEWMQKLMSQRKAVNLAARSAPAYLNKAASEIEDRAKLRDTPEGERSMGKTVAAFNAIYGTELTETMGWNFQELLKMARSSGGMYHEDDFVDKTAYAALAAESAYKEAKQVISE